MPNAMMPDLYALSHLILTPQQVGLVICIFTDEDNWGTEKSNNLLKATQLISDSFLFEQTPKPIAFLATVPSCHIKVSLFCCHSKIQRLSQKISDYDLLVTLPEVWITSELIGRKIITVHDSLKVLSLDQDGPKDTQRNFNWIAFSVTHCC